MKKILALAFAVLMLTGCGAAEVYETIHDEPVLETVPQPREVYFQLAEDPVMPAMESDSGQLYLCGDYDLMVQTLESGDLDSSVLQVSGFLPEELTILQTGSGEVDKYEFVWTSAADGGHQIGRATILDDGNYHYILSATIDSELIGEYQEIWNGIFESFKLV